MLTALILAAATPNAAIMEKMAEAAYISGRCEWIYTPDSQAQTVAMFSKISPELIKLYEQGKTDSDKKRTPPDTCKRVTVQLMLEIEALQKR